jgi:nitrile hydratase accessory protein
MAVALHSQGAFEWDDFRGELMRAIGAWEREHDDDEPWSYYRCWLTALERVLRERGIVHTGEVDDRAVSLAARPAGHDHRDHDHG